jgi:hypothetical protein
MYGFDEKQASGYYKAACPNILGRSFIRGDFKDERIYKLYRTGVIAVRTDGTDQCPAIG